MAGNTAKKETVDNPLDLLSKEEYSKLQKKVVDAIIVARIGLLLRAPWFGNMATRLTLENCDSWCPTAATNGRTFYYNTFFFSQLDYKEIEFVIAHEILHCALDHLGRRGDRIDNIHNIACDFVANNVLVRDKIGTPPKQIKIFQDFKYDGMTSEEVYDILLDEAEDEIDKLGQLLDEHIEWSDSDNDDNESNKPTMSQEELEKIREEVKEAMIQAAQTAGAGNMPAEIERMISTLTEPKMNWREMLQQQIQSTIKNDFSFQRFNKKSQHTGAILPGMNFDETIDICVGVDMSGSICDTQALTFLSEIKGIMDMYEDFKLKVWCFDTRVYNEQDFDSYDNDIQGYRVIGGGGTYFLYNCEYMKSNDIQPKKFIMFTDGYPWNSWGDPDYCDTLFIIHGHHDKTLTAPFGATAHYEDHV